MHKTCNLEIDNLTRIVGHTSLDVKIKNGKAVKAKLEVEENRRFIKEALVGKPYSVAPQIVSRICGTCGISHMLCSIETIEKAFGFKPSKQTMILRHLASYANVLRDHALHLYFLILPDLLGKESILDLEQSHHDLIHDALDVKKAGNVLAKTIAGRSVHATSICVGGFTQIPKSKEVKDAIKILKKVRPKVVNALEIFSSGDYEFKKKAEFVSLKTKDFGFLEGFIQTSYGDTVGEENFGKHLKEFILPYSTADAFKFDGHVFMVGALARINNNMNNLHKKTKKDAKKYLKHFPSQCVFKCNLAQAIEMLHCVDQSIELLTKTNFKKEKPNKIVPKASEGTGVIEAPRGTLYHNYKINSSGKITDAELIIPTAQNIIKIQQDVVTLINSLIKTKSKKYITSEVEKLIRAFDPCMNCATHFLKINWN